MLNKKHLSTSARVFLLSLCKAELESILIQSRYYESYHGHLLDSAILESIITSYSESEAVLLECINYLSFSNTDETE